MVRASMICCCHRKSTGVPCLLFLVAARLQLADRASGDMADGRGCDGAEVGQQCHEKLRNGSALVRLPLAGDRSEEKNRRAETADLLLELAVYSD